MSEKEPESFYPANREKWREWLEDNHSKKQSVWLICYKAGSGVPTISWSEAVDEALCFGWIDGKRKSVDDKKFIQYFCRRKAFSTWSKVNKDKVQNLIESKRMTGVGLEIIEIAKQNGSWTIFDEAEALIIPDDLEAEFKTRPGSKEFFMGLSRSVRKNILQWIVLAKRKETREKRILEIAECAEKRMKPPKFI